MNFAIKFLGIILCGVAGAVAAHYGGGPALMAVVIAEVGMFLIMF